MIDLQQLFHEIEKLPPEELEQVRQFVEERSQHLAQPEEVDEWMAALDAAVVAFRDGLSEDEIQEIIEAMNEEVVTADEDKF